MYVCLIYAGRFEFFNSHWTRLADYNYFCGSIFTVEVDLVLLSWIFTSFFHKKVRMIFFLEAQGTYTYNCYAMCPAG